MISVEELARAYRVPLLDYGQDRGGALLVSSGCGIMMAAMDQSRHLRWCLDIDRLDQTTDLVSFAVAAQRQLTDVAMCGWFSLTDPRLFRELAGVLERAPVVYAAPTRLGVAREVASLDAMLGELDAAASGARRPMIVGMMSLRDHSHPVAVVGADVRRRVDAVSLLPFHLEHPPVALLQRRALGVRMGRPTLFLGRRVARAFSCPDAPTLSDDTGPVAVASPHTKYWQSPANRARFDRWIDRLGVVPFS